MKPPLSTAFGPAALQFAVFLSAAALVSCSDRGTVELTETHIFTLPDNASEDDIYISQDGKHWLYKIKTDEGVRVAGDRNYGENPYKEMSDIRWSAKTGRCGFYAIRSGIQLVVDGKEYPTGSRSEGDLLWSPDGNHWLARFGEQGASVVMYDGKEVGRHFTTSAATFSRGSAHYAYVAVEEGGFHLVVDAQKVRQLKRESPEEVKKGGFAVIGAWFSSLEFLSGGEVSGIVPLSDADSTKEHAHANYAVIRGDKTIAQYGEAVGLYGNNCMSLTDKDAEDLGQVAFGSLAVSESGAAVAWYARPGKEGSPWYCYLDGKTVAENPNVSPCNDGISLSPDGKHVAFKKRHDEGEGEARKTVGYSVWADGKDGPAYDRVRGITFSPDSKKCAYLATRLGTKGTIYVVDGKEVGVESDNNWSFSFSPDSLHYAYASRRGKQRFMVYDGAEYPLPYDEVWGLRLIARGTPQYFAQKAKAVYVVSGIPARAKP